MCLLFAPTKLDHFSSIIQTLVQCSRILAPLYRVKRKIKQIGGCYVKQSSDKKWNCPICDKITHIPHLYIDKYVHLFTM